MTNADNIYKAFGVQKALQKNRGPVDRLTGGRVKLETNPDKQFNPEGSKPFLGLPGVEVQSKVKRGGLADRAQKKVGFKTVTPQQKTEAAGLEYAPKMQKAVVSSQKFLDNDCGCDE